MAKILLISVAFLLDRDGAMALQRGVQKIASLSRVPTNNTCQKSGSLFFSHIMKDGGESVNAYLQCICKKKTCSGLLREGLSRGGWGTEQCEPSVCSSHGAVAHRADDCGPKFWKASTFTVLRDPVDRVYSLYNYYKYVRVDPFFQNHSLVDILQSVKTCTANPDCHTLKLSYANEFTEGMVHWYFANYNVQWWLRSKNTTTSATDTLAHAKEMLASFDAVFFMDDFARFPDLWHKSGLPLSSYKEKECEFIKVNKNMCWNCTITEMERRLISELNDEDIELYKYAKTLPNAMV